MMRYFILLPFLLFFGNAFSQETSIKKEKWHWNNNKLKQDTVAGYTQVLKVDNILYISGAVATEISPEGITSLYNDLKASLASFGATFENVVKENLYTTILTPNLFTGPQSKPSGLWVTTCLVAALMAFAIGKSPAFGQNLIQAS